MADTGTKETLDKFFGMLQVSPGTTRVNVLHTMCLMPLFEDILGGKMKRFALQDKRCWQKLLDNCFPWLRFTSDTSSAMNTLLYIGTGVNLPDGDNIATESISYDISSSQRMISPRVMGNYFWIAVPSGFALSKANNLDFGGDYIGASGFKMSSKTIRNGQYNFYWLRSLVPFKSTYQIILK